MAGLQAQGGSCCTKALWWELVAGEKGVWEMILREEGRYAENRRWFFLVQPRSPKALKAVLMAMSSPCSLTLHLTLHYHVCIFTPALASESRMAHVGKQGSIETTGKSFRQDCSGLWIRAFQVEKGRMRARLKSCVQEKALQERRKSEPLLRRK